MPVGKQAVTLGTDTLGQLMPMHVHLSAEGRIIAIGPTLAKISASRRLIGAPFFKVFDLRRPPISDIAGLFAQQGCRLQLAMRGVLAADFRGIAMSDVDNGLILNLSFGIGVTEAVRALRLTDADFAPTDLAVELLWLAEAKHAVMEELRRLNARLLDEKTMAEELATRDTLTGVLNRRGLDLVLTKACSGKRPFSLMLLDLDHFKRVNDSLGHAAGDHVLREVAGVLMRETRASDTVARVGGDEFVILLPGVTDVDELTRMAERIIAGMQRPILFNETPCTVGVSVGVAISTDHKSLSTERLLDDADRALYAAKRAGRARMERAPGAA